MDEAVLVEAEAHHRARAAPRIEPEKALRLVERHFEGAVADQLRAAQAQISLGLVDGGAQLVAPAFQRAHPAGSDPAVGELAGREVVGDGPVQRQEACIERALLGGAAALGLRAQMVEEHGRFRIGQHLHAHQGVPERNLGIAGTAQIENAAHRPVAFGGRILQFEQRQPRVQVQRRFRHERFDHGAGLGAALVPRQPLGLGDQDVGILGKDPRVEVELLARLVVAAHLFEQFRAADRHVDLAGAGLQAAGVEVERGVQIVLLEMGPADQRQRFRAARVLGQPELPLLDGPVVAAFLVGQIALAAIGFLARLGRQVVQRQFARGELVVQAQVQVGRRRRRQFLRGEHLGHGVLQLRRAGGGFHDDQRARKERGDGRERRQLGQRLGKLDGELHVVLLRVLIDLLQPRHEGGNLVGRHEAAIQMEAVDVHRGGLARRQIGGNLPGQRGGPHRQPGQDVRAAHPREDPHAGVVPLRQDQGHRADGIQPRRTDRRETERVAPKFVHQPRRRKHVARRPLFQDVARPGEVQRENPRFRQADFGVPHLHAEQAGLAVAQQVEGFLQQHPAVELREQVAPLEVDFQILLLARIRGGVLGDGLGEFLRAEDLLVHPDVAFVVEQQPHAFFAAGARAQPQAELAGHHAELDPQREVAEQVAGHQPRQRAGGRLVFRAGRLRPEGFQRQAALGRMFRHAPIRQPARGVQRAFHFPRRGRPARFDDGGELLGAPLRIHPQAVQRARIGVARVQQERPGREAQPVGLADFRQIRDARGHRARIELAVVAVGKREGDGIRPHALLEFRAHLRVVPADARQKLLRCFQPALGLAPARRREEVGGFAVGSRRDALEARHRFRADLPGARAHHVAQDRPAQGVRIPGADRVGPHEHDGLPAVGLQNLARFQIGILLALLQRQQHRLAGQRLAVPVERLHVREADGIEAALAQEADVLGELRAGHLVGAARLAAADAGIGQRDEAVRVADAGGGGLVAVLLVGRAHRHPQAGHEGEARQEQQPRADVAVAAHRLRPHPAGRARRGRRRFRLRRGQRRGRLGRRGFPQRDRNRRIVRRIRAVARPAERIGTVVGRFVEVPLHPRVPQWRPRMVARAQ